MAELDKQMYFGAAPAIIGRAKELRKKMTEAEKLLWSRLTKKQIAGVRFRRQHPINQFIADFYSHKARLIIEVDGKIHQMQKEYDIGRTDELSKFNLKVIRFTNEEIQNNIEHVIKVISDHVNERLKSPPWGFRGNKSRIDS